MAIGAMDMVQQRVTDGIRSVVKGPIGTNIQRAMDLFKKDDTADHFDTSGQDVSSNPLNIFSADASSNPLNMFKTDASSNLFKIDTPSDWASKKSTSDWIWFGLTLLLCVMYAVFTANSMIFVPWPLRLVTFLLVLFGSWAFGSVFIIVSLYYIGYIFTSMYKRSLLKEGDPPIRLLPKLYTMLPLRTAKGGMLDTLLFPFTYFAAGDQGSAYQLYKFDEADYIESIKQQIPDWNSIKNTLGVPTLLAEFIDHLDRMNVAYTKDVSGNIGSTLNLPESTDVGELLTMYNETTKLDDFKRRKILDMLNRKLDPVDTERLDTLGDYIQGLMKERRFGEAIAFSRILLGKRQVKNKVSKESDQARSTLLKALMAREKEVGLKVEELTKQIATDKANGTDTKKLDLEKSRLEQASTTIREEIDRLGQKVRSASIMPAYDVDGKDLNKEINVLMNSISSALAQEGGFGIGATLGLASALTRPKAPTPAIAAPEPTEKEKKIKGLFNQINTVFDAKESVSWAELANAKAHILHLNSYTQILERSRDMTAISGISNEIVQGILDETLADKNLRKAKVEAAHEDTEHAISTISKHADLLHKQASLYDGFKKKLAAYTGDAKQVVDEEVKAIDARIKKIETLWNLIHPKGFDVNNDLTRVLALIPESTGSVSSVKFASKKPEALALAEETDDLQEEHETVTRRRNEIIGHIGAQEKWIDMAKNQVEKTTAQAAASTKEYREKTAEITSAAAAIEANSKRRIGEALAKSEEANRIAQEAIEQHRISENAAIEAEREAEERKILANQRKAAASWRSVPGPDQAHQLRFRTDPPISNSYYPGFRPSLRRPLLKSQESQVSNEGSIQKKP